MKKLKHMFSFALVTAVLFSTLSTPARAANLGTLNYWDSDQSAIGRWAANSLTIRTIKLNSDGLFPFRISLDHASSQWETALDITLTNSSTSLTGAIEYYGGTREEIKTYTGYELPVDVTGFTRYYYRYDEGTWTYNNTSKTGYLHSSVYCYLVDIIDGDGNHRSLSAYKNTATHELGHGLGWYGHSVYSSDIMYATATTVTTLTGRDERHLSQVY